MIFSMPIEISFKVLNELIKRKIPYTKYVPDEEPDDFVIEIDVDEDFVEEATEITNRVAEQFNLGRGKLRQD